MPCQCHRPRDVGTRAQRVGSQARQHSLHVSQRRGGGGASVAVHQRKGETGGGGGGDHRRHAAARHRAPPRIVVGRRDAPRLHAHLRAQAARGVQQHQVGAVAPQRARQELVHGGWVGVGGRRHVCVPGRSTEGGRRGRQAATASSLLLRRTCHCCRRCPVARARVLQQCRHGGVQVRRQRITPLRRRNGTRHGSC